MAAAPTLDELQHYFELDAKRLALQREATALGKLQEALETKFEAYVRGADGEGKQKTRFGFLLAIDQKRENVKWQREYLLAFGPDKVKELQESQPMKDVLSIKAPVK